MNHFIKDFRYSGCSFSEATEPSELNSAIGSLAINFSVLEDELSSAVICLLGTKTEEGLAVTSEMSFKSKLNVFSSLMKRKLEFGGYAYSPSDFRDLLAMCTKSEEFRNRLLHSAWVHDHAKKEIRRRKHSAKISKGFRHDEEPLTPGQVLDIADYIIYTAVSVEEFIMNCFPEFKRPLESIVYA